MIRIENEYVTPFKSAFRGMRNPYNSWEKSTPESDMELACKLISAGTEHRKFLRMIHVTADVTAPLFWWKEYDTYKVGTTANSCSTMHTLTKRAFTKEDFSFEDLYPVEADGVIAKLEDLRVHYAVTKDRRAWRRLIAILPSSYNQMRTVDLDYETLLSIHRQRKNHKLEEWHVFCDWIEGLPMMGVFIEAAEGGKNDN